MSRYALLSTLFAFTLAGQMTSLQQYLGLTDQQVAALQNLNSTYQSYVTEKDQRIYQLENEIGVEDSRDVIDPSALGTRYAEIELIERDLRDHLAKLQKDAAAILTVAQTAQLQSLDSAARLEPLIEQTGCAYLENYLALRSSTPSYFTPVAVYIYGDFTNITPFPPGLAPVPDSLPPAQLGCSLIGSYALAAYLSLTDAQVDTMMRAIATYQDYVTRKQGRITEVQNDIRDRQNADPIDSLALGMSYLEILAIQRDLTAQDQSIRSGNRAVLTPQQQPKLQVLETAIHLRPLIAQAECSNLLVPPPISGGSLPNPFLQINCLLQFPLAGNEAASPVQPSDRRSVRSIYSR